MVSYLTSAEAQKASIFCQIFCQKNLATWTHNFHNILGCDKTQRAFLRCCDTGNVIHIMLVLLPIDMVFPLFALPIEAKYMTIGTKACCCVSGYRLFFIQFACKQPPHEHVQTTNPKFYFDWCKSIKEHQSMTLQWPRSCDCVAQCHDLAIEEVEVKVGPTEMEKQVGN